MKRFLFTIILMGLMVIFMEPASNLMSRFLRLNGPETHEIQNGEWLSKVAVQYYGDVSYWKELALVNRAPNGNLIYPGEKIIVPGFDAIQKIRKSRSLSSVNDIVGIQQDILAGKVEHNLEPLSELEQTSGTMAALGENNIDNKTQMPVQDTQAAEQESWALDDALLGSSEEESSVLLSTPVLTALVFLGVILAIGLFLFLRSRKRQEEVTYYGDSPEIVNERPVEDSKEKSIYFFGDDKEEKPNNGKKNKKEELEIV